MEKLTDEMCSLHLVFCYYRRTKRAFTFICLNLTLFSGVAYLRKTSYALFWLLRASRQSSFHQGFGRFGSLPDVLWIDSMAEFMICSVRISQIFSTIFSSLSKDALECIEACSNMSGYPLQAYIGENRSQLREVGHLFSVE